MRALSPKPGGQILIKTTEVAAAFMQNGIQPTVILTNGAEIALNGKSLDDVARDTPGAIMTREHFEGRHLVINPAHVLAAVEQTDGATVVYLRAPNRAFAVPLTIDELRAKVPNV